MDRTPPARLPPGLRTDWPVPRLEVVGTRDGFLAELECLLARGALGGLARLPRATRETVVSALARLAKTFDRGHSEAARAFLRQAFGATIDARELERRVLDAWKHFLRVTIESEGFTRHVDVTRIREHFELEAPPDFDRVRASGKGAILVTLHLGDWECGSAILPWLGFDPLYVIAKPPRNKPLSVHLQRLREARGLRVLPRRGAMKHAAAILASGGSLAMLLDQRARTRPAMAPFFGRQAACDRSAGVLVRRLKSPVMVGAIYRLEPYHWRAVVSRVFWPEDMAGRSPEAVAALLNAEFETLIRRAPEQYFWLHDRYRGAVESDADPDEDET